MLTAHRWQIVVWIYEPPGYGVLPLRHSAGIIEYTFSSSKCIGNDMQSHRNERDSQGTKKREFKVSENKT